MFLLKELLEMYLKKQIQRLTRVETLNVNNIEVRNILWPWLQSFSSYSKHLLGLNASVNNLIKILSHFSSFYKKLILNSWLAIFTKLITFPKEPCPSTFSSSKWDGSAFITFADLMTIVLISNSECTSWLVDGYK